MNLDNNIKVVIILMVFIVVFKYFIKCNIENYTDPYSIDLQAEAINRMKRWNYNSSKGHWMINDTASEPIYYNSYYNNY